jgi:hypothetical protein
VGNFKNYYDYVQKEAKSLFMDQRKELFNTVKEESVDLYEFFDDSIFEWVDSEFIRIDLHDCADILESSNNVETDSGLWEGQEPLKAVETMAFFTYRADLTEAVIDYAKWELDERLKDEEQELKNLQQELVSFEEKIAEADERYDEICDDEDREQEAEDLEIELERLNGAADGCSEMIGDKEQFIEYLEDTLNN